MTLTQDERDLARGMRRHVGREDMTLFGFNLSAYNRWWHNAETQRFTQRALTPAELAVEIERYERLLALDLLDLDDGDFTDDEQWSLLWRVTTIDMKLTELERQAQRLIRLHVVNGQTPDIDFERAHFVDMAPLVETVTAQRLRQQGDRHVGRCPFHEDWEPSLVIYAPGKGWHCFQCGMGGQDAASFCAAFFHCSQIEGLRWVEQLVHVPGAA